ncbi:hypothetical protein [Zhongshania sp.]|uniref:hypothetical protein n=1 Tax=Zhongshania sp. TaxID=1971902 RepID=UPI00356ADE09
MDTVKWFAYQLKKPVWLAKLAKLIAVAAMLVAMSLVTRDLPNNLAQPWWWNFH